MNPRDPPTWQLLASHSKALSDAMKNLIMAIRLLPQFMDHVPLQMYVLSHSERVVPDRKSVTRLLIH